MLCNEFDPDRKALIDPQEQFRPIAGFPEICVMAFSAHIVEKCLERYGGEQIADVPFCTGRVPIYRVVIDGTEVALSMPHVGGTGCQRLHRGGVAPGREVLRVLRRRRRAG